MGIIAWAVASENRDLQFILIQQFTAEKREGNGPNRKTLHAIASFFWLNNKSWDIIGQIFSHFNSNHLSYSYHFIMLQPKNKPMQSFSCFVYKQVRPNWYLSFLGSGCGTVGSTVASDTRGPGFQSSYRQLLLNNYLLLTDC